MNPTDYPTLRSGLATSIIHGGVEDWKYDEDFDESVYEAFTAEFEFVTSRALGDPKEDWYQGVNFTAVIRRRSDDALFGYPYWEPVSKHGEPYYEPNGDNDEYMFYPVVAFNVPGYEVQTPKENAA